MIKCMICKFENARFMAKITDVDVPYCAACLQYASSDIKVRELTDFYATQVSFE